MPNELSYPHNRKVIYNVVLFGTYLATAAITILLWRSFSLKHNTQAVGPLIVCGAAFLYIGLAHVLAFKRRYRVAAYLLLGFYTLMASGIVWSWGINSPMGLLIFGLVIVLSGILLTARHVLFAAALSSVILLAIQMAIALHWYTPDTTCACNDSSFSQVIAYSTVFGMLALISWLYNREIERALRQAREAEAALQEQKATLKLQVKERTAELRRVQLGEMQHMYRFAKLGQMGVTLLHDLANHLTALTLEIDSLQGKKHAKAIAPAMQIIQYLDNVVANARERLHGDVQERTFDIIQKTSEALAYLHYKAEDAKVTIDWQPPAQSWQYKGDPAGLSQIIALIVSNAIDAYEAPKEDSDPNERKVAIAMQRTDTHIIIHVSDWGKGIVQNRRKQLFKPFHSTKKTGLGLGLFIARQAIEAQFSGTIVLSPRTDYTEFIIKLPLKNGK
jgi:signal transduction histidine kinase